jgi:hypothetical protein
LFLLIFLIFSSPFIILFIKEYTIRKNELSTISENERHFITASIVDYFLPSRFSILFLPFVENFHNKFAYVYWPVDSVISLGYTILICTFLLLPKILKNYPQSKLWLICFFISFYLSLGDIIVMYKDSRISNVINEIIFSLPGFNIIRNPSRGAIYTLFSLLILFSYAMLHISKTKRHFINKIILICILLFIEFWPIHFDWYYTIEIPHMIEKIKEEKENVTVLNIPFGYSGYTGNSHAMYLQAIHKKPIIDGHTSRLFKEYIKNLDLLMQYIKTNNTTEAVRLLLTYNVKYIIICKKMFDVAKKINPEVSIQEKLLEVGSFKKIDENDFFIIFERSS